MTESQDVKAAQFCQMFVRAIIAWNNAEESARSILEGLSKGGVGASIAIRQLGNTSLPDALGVLCKFIRSSGDEIALTQAEHIEHFIQGYGILRGYRNFYVHNLRAVGENEEQPPQFVGLLHTIDVKGGYSWVQQDLTMSEIFEFTQKTIELSQYGDGIAKNVKPLNALATQLYRPTPLTLLQKPIWPERLKKNRESLIGPP